MIPRDSGSFSDGEYEDPGELGWSEFDWEKYLRAQDDIVHRYLGFYESLKDSTQRIDDVARCMGWDIENSQEPEVEEPELDDDDDDDDDDDAPYTLQRNPVFVATTAIEMSVQRSWARLAASPSQVPQTTALNFLSAMHGSETQALLAIQALDLGDYSMAVSLLKRAMRELNVALSHLHASDYPTNKAAVDFRDDTVPMLFDLREIWLRVIAECREEFGRQEKKKDEGEQEP